MKASNVRTPGGNRASDETEQCTNNADFRCLPSFGQAQSVIEGEAYAPAHLDRLHAGNASPDDLAVLMAFLQGEMQAGACGVIEKALGVRRA